MKYEPTRVVDASAIATIAARVGLGPFYDLVVERLIGAFASLDGQFVEQRERDGFLLTIPHQGLLEWMPAVRQGETVSIKMVGYNPHNPSKYRLPTVLSTLCAFDAATGHLRTIVDGTFATAIRTGAASAVASTVLADPQSRVLGLVGCGAQAVTQLHALSRCFDFTQILVSDQDANAERTFHARSRFPRELVTVVPVDEIERRADIVCTATSVLPGMGPVLPGLALKSTVHVNAVGSDMPGKTELPLSLLRSAVVCPDHKMQASKEGECQQLDEHEIGPSLGSLLHKPGEYEHLRDVRTVYDSTGFALQDLVMVEVLEELAAVYQVGERLVIEAVADDPQDPYAFLHDAITQVDWVSRKVSLR